MKDGIKLYEDRKIRPLSQRGNTKIHSNLLGEKSGCLDIKSSNKHNYASWVSALSTFGLFSITLYGIFFSNFSQAIVERLERENDVLQSTQTDLKLRFSEEKVRAENLALLNEASQTELDRLNIDVNEAEGLILTKSQQVEALQTKIEKLQLDEQVATEQLEKVIGELVKLHEEGFEAKIDEFLGKGRVSAYLSRRLNNALRNKTQIEYSDHLKAYEDIVSLLNGALADANSNLHRTIIQERSSRILERCPDHSTFDRLVMEGLIRYKPSENDEFPINPNITPQEEIDIILNRQDSRRKERELLTEAQDDYHRRTDRALEFCIEGR